jgi:acyl carrier protein
MPRGLPSLAATPENGGPADNMPDPLAARLKSIIVDTLRLEGVTPDQIKDEEPLIGSGLALDSVDVLELVLKIEKDYGIKIASSEESKKALVNVAALCAFIRERADPARLPS